MKAAPDRCKISLRTAEYAFIIERLVEYECDGSEEQERDALVYKLTNAETAAKARGDAAKVEADLT